RSRSPGRLETRKWSSSGLVLSAAVRSVLVMTQTTDTTTDTTTDIRVGEVAWANRLLEQLAWHWENHVRPRLDGLTDVEYLWEPASGCWNLRQQSGVWVPDFAWPEPDPAPLTTIAWRLSHAIVGLFGMRLADHFGGPSVSYQTAEYAGDAATALAQLDAGY